MGVNDYSDIFLDVTRGSTGKNLICLKIDEDIAKSSVSAPILDNRWINIDTPEAYELFHMMLLVADNHGCEIVPTAELAERDGTVAEVWKIQRKS